MTKPSRYVTVEEAAELLPAGKPGKAHMTRAQLYNVIRSGELRFVKRKVLRRADVLRLADRRARAKAREEAAKAAKEKRQRLEQRIAAAVMAEDAAEGGGSDALGKV